MSPAHFATLAAATRLGPDMTVAARMVLVDNHTPAYAAIQFRVSRQAVSAAVQRVMTEAGWEVVTVRVPARTAAQIRRIAARATQG